jgi:hypothetical protein
MRDHSSNRARTIRPLFLGLFAAALSVTGCGDPGALEDEGAGEGDTDTVQLFGFRDPVVICNPNTHEYSCTPATATSSPVCSCRPRPQPAAQNIALGKPSFQSTDLPGFTAVASRANDGNTNGNFWANSVTHTNNGLFYPNEPSGTMRGQHWYVFLNAPNMGPGVERLVKSITIHNRTDCCGDRLKNFNILAWNSADEAWQVIASQGSTPIGGSKSFSFASAMVRTRYVMVAKTDADYLSLAEVQVFGY